VGISNLVVGFNPEAIVGSGEIARAWELVEGAFTEAIDQSVRRELPTARILPSTLGEKPTLRGRLASCSRASLPLDSPLERQALPRSLAAPAWSYWLHLRPFS